MTTKHNELMKDPAFRQQLAVELLVAEAAEIIAQRMSEKGMSKADLARELKKSRAWVTQLLSGKNNLTIRTLAEVIHTLGGKVEITCSSPMGTRAARSR
ncbi:MAG: helix-turn-helix transcriptional regulator [Acidobacteria bacterium]|nr:helix-turn-helix transcriptional regulator [Acidobacteriota bacterium]